MHVAMTNVFAALVPEAPTNLRVAAESTTSIRATWDSPPETNGPIVTYKVCFPLHCCHLGMNEWMTKIPYFSVR